MPKRFLRAAVIAIFTVSAPLALPGLSQAQGEAGLAFYGIDVNASLGFAVPNTDEFGSGFFIRGGAGYELNRHFAVSAGLGWFSSSVDNDMDVPPGNTIADGELGVIPLTLSLEARHPFPELYGTLYGIAGIGYYFIDYSWSGGAKEYFDEVERLYGIPVSQEVSNSFGFDLGAGFEYPLTAQLFFNAEGQYIFLQPEAEGVWRDLITGEPHVFKKDLDMNTWIFTLGVKYLF